MAMRFYGSTDPDYVTLGQPSSLALDPTADYTISCWAKTEDTSGYGTFVGKGDGGGLRQAQLTYGSPGPPYELQCIVGGTFYTSGVKGGNAQWHHCALVNFDLSGTQSFQLYHDGATAGSVGTSGTSTQAVDVMIGARRDTGNTGAGFVMRGTLADVRIYSRALSAVEISTIYAQKGHDNIIEGLEGRWLMIEESPGTAATVIVKDISYNGNNGTPSDSPDYAEDILTFKRKRPYG